MVITATAPTMPAVAPGRRKAELKECAWALPTVYGGADRAPRAVDSPGAERARVAASTTKLKVRFFYGISPDDQKSPVERIKHMNVRKSRWILRKNLSVTGNVAVRNKRGARRAEGVRAWH